MDNFKKKLQYWFDNQMSKGARSMILMLGVITVGVVLIITGIISCIEPNEDGVTNTIWDVATTVINAWMPYSEEGGLGYLIPTALAAVFGLLFTSVLIGIVSTAIEEKIDALRKGNSIVVESGHTVVLGFESGAYEVLAQIIASAAGEPLCLVVAGEGEKEEMESEIRENLDVPKQVRLICRHVDMCSAASLECCSIETASSVIISCYDDMKTVKSVLAVNNYLKAYPETEVQIIAAVTKDEFVLPETLTKKNRITMIQTNDMIARIIAHSCSQPGISKAFYEVLNFDGAELYVSGNPDIQGKTFWQLYQTMSGGVPVGIVRGDEALFRHAPEATLEEGDRLVYLSTEKNGYTLLDRDVAALPARKQRDLSILTSRKLLIIGCNDQIETILSELPHSVEQIVFAALSDKEQEALASTLHRFPEKRFSFAAEDLFAAGALEQAVDGVDHVILLNRDEGDREESDMRNILIYLNLVDLQIRLGKSYNVTMELFYENNRELIRRKNNTDFVVANNMSALLVSQLAVTPRLNRVYDELLSNEGVEIRLVAPGEDMLGEISIHELRQKSFLDGMILLGYVQKTGKELETVLNPDLDALVTLDDESMLVVIG